MSSTQSSITSIPNTTNKCCKKKNGIKNGTLDLKDVEFSLPKSFLKKYKGKQPDWGALGYITFKRTYARSLIVENDDGVPIFYKKTPDNTFYFYTIENDFQVRLYKLLDTDKFLFEPIEPVMDRSVFDALLDENNVRFGDAVGHVIYTGRTEEYWQTIKRVVEGVFRLQKWHCKLPQHNYEWKERKALASAKRMYEKIWEGKFTPAGRGLWMMGTDFIQKHGSMALNNCFAGETEIITRNGIKCIKDCVNTTQTILTINSEWVKAPIQSFGVQPLMKITLTRNGIEKNIFATPEHRWFFKTRKNINGTRDNAKHECYTKDLQEGYTIPYIFSHGIAQLRMSPFGVAHGICFGDGTYNHLYLCGEKKRELARFFPLNEKIDDANKCEGGAIRISNLPSFFKKNPSLSEDANYLYGWFAGYFATDGSCKQDGGCIITSSKKENILFVRDVCTILGIGYYALREENRISNLTNETHTMYELRLIPSTLHEDFFIRSDHKLNFVNTESQDKEVRVWKVKSIESTNRNEEVFCAVVDEKHVFTLEGNVMTSNCGFISTKNIKSEGSKAFAWMMDAEMLGVGVGFDVRGGFPVPKPSFVFSTADQLKTQALEQIKSMSFDDIKQKKEKIPTSFIEKIGLKPDDPTILERYIANEIWKVEYHQMEQELTQKILADYEKMAEVEKHKYTIVKQPKYTNDVYVIPDSREGWVQSLRYVIDPFIFDEETLETENIARQSDPDYDGSPLYMGIPKFDYSQIRKKGLPIRGFGGKSSGPDPLIKLHEYLIQILTKHVGQPLRTTDIVYICTNIGKCVIAGNVRRCLAESMEVHTNRGLLPIDKVLLTDKVLVHDGSYRQVKNIFKQGKQKTIKIRTTMGDIICTPNHRMAIFDGLKSYTWKEAGKINPKTDRLLSVPHIEGKNTITPEFAWLIGYYHGDGHSDYLRLQENGHGGGSLSFAMSKKNYDNGLKEKFDLVLNQIGFEPRPYHQGNSTHIRIYDKEISKKFITYKQPNTMSVIPREVWEGNAQIRSAYLAGICDSDGGVRNTLIWTKYPKFARQIQKIALSLGIATTFHEGNGIKIVKGKEYEDCNSVTLRGLIAQQRAKRYIEPFCAVWHVDEKSEKKNGLSLPYEFLIQAKKQGIITFDPLSSGLIRPTKKNFEEIDIGNGQVQLIEIKYRDANFDTLIEKNLVSDQWLPIEIDSIEDAGEQETYDLEIENNHEFVCENFLVHNSAEIGLSEIEDHGYMTMKEPDHLIYNSLNIEEYDSLWATNNSIFVKVGDNYKPIVDSIIKNGEPGLIWLQNAREYGRMRDSEHNYDDMKIDGCNPCFVGDTLIAVADGRNAVPIKQLAEEGQDVPVYAVNEAGMVEIKMARRPRLTRTNAELVKITLDDQSTLVVTPDHSMRLLNGDRVQARNLKYGDSLPQFSKYTEKFDQNSSTRYYMIRTNICDLKKNRKAEHRLIAKFHYPDQWEEMYDDEEQHGWLHGDLVVHHRDGNGLNNHLDNLEMKLFSNHMSDHGRNLTGMNNPMYGREHSEKTKQLIGQTTKDRCQDITYKNKLAQAIKDGMNNETTRTRLSEAQKAEHKKYYEEFERTTDLETVWQDDRLYVVKYCEICHTKMILPINQRDHCYCSRSCTNKSPDHKAVRNAGQTQYFTEKQKETRHRQIMIYKDLVHELGRDPSKTEWEDVCKKQQIPIRFNPKSANEFAIKSYKDLKQIASSYNHRVISVESLSYTEDVYNLTVDEHHTIGIITHCSENTYSGIFTFNCSEQSLEHLELCNLVETFPSRHTGCVTEKDGQAVQLTPKEEYLETLKYAYLYAKSVTLLNTHWSETNTVIHRNRRMGISMTGIVDAIGKFGYATMIDWCEEGYKYLKKLDDIYREWLCVSHSKKLSTVKPSGTISLLFGVSSGIHFPHAEYYIRRMRIDRTSPIVEECRRCGYHVYPDPDSYITIEKDGQKITDYTTEIVEFPIHEENFVRGKDDVTMWEQIALIVAWQRHWSDNQLSCTVTFKKHEAKDIQRMLEINQYYLKGISLFPEDEHGYKNAPYEAITKEVYEHMKAQITDQLRLADLILDEGTGENFCVGIACERKIQGTITTSSKFTALPSVNIKVDLDLPSSKQEKTE